jgi:OmcA/MtrC family decaheme c-type cytochrome
MTKWVKTQKIGMLFLLFFSISAFGVAALVDDSSQVYSALDKAFYLSAQDAVWISPGLNIVVQDLTIPADRKPVVTIKITDNRGQGLDRAGILTPGTVNPSYIFAYLPKGQSQYVSYYTRTAGPTPSTSPVVGATTLQAATHNTGTYVSKGDGTYTYTFSVALPANYDTSATHTLGIYATRNLTEFGLSNYVSNVTKNFVPNGSQVTQVREVVSLAACNQCHNPLSAHGGSRRDIKICILCHTPQTIDPDTGNTVDMKVMAHKIHMGDNLPSVKAGTPYVIVGNSQSVHDFSTVALPRDPRSCTTCHKDASQAVNWQLNPTRDACGACHDTIDWVSGANHVAGRQPNDNHCADCHYPQGDYEWDASVSGAHTVPDKSTSLRKPVGQIISVTNAGPGKSPTVQFKIVDKDNNAIAPVAMSRLSLRLAGPTSDYKWYLSETATAATSVNGGASYTFKGVIPADATGTYSVGMEGRITTNLTSTASGPFTYSDALNNVVKYFAVTGTTVTPRRKVVDVAKCNTCHERLQLHGNSRNDPEYCIGCHNPTKTDGSSRPAAAGPNDSINFKYMIHKIHSGEELEGGYQIGNGSFSEVRYPGDRRDCLQCHVGTSYTLPLSAGQIGTVVPHNYWTPLLPAASACMGCHDSVEVAAHALLNTASIGESCSVCHKESAEFAVSKMHAR